MSGVKLTRDDLTVGEVQLRDGPLRTLDAEQGSCGGLACGGQEVFVPLDSAVQHLPLSLHLEAQT